MQATYSPWLVALSIAVALVSYTARSLAARMTLGMASATQAMGGTIEVQSSLGHGSTFSFAVSLAATTVATAAATLERAGEESSARAAWAALLTAFDATVSEWTRTGWVDSAAPRNSTRVTIHT